jgi:hypothetical protein
MGQSVMRLPASAAVGFLPPDTDPKHTAIISALSTNVFDGASH